MTGDADSRLVLLRAEVEAELRSYLRRTRSTALPREFPHAKDTASYVVVARPRQGSEETCP